MKRWSVLSSLCALGAFFFLVGCGASSTTRASEGPVATPPEITKVDSSALAPGAPPVVAHVDSTSPEPRPQVLVEGIAFTGVRTRLIPHVMGRGWALSVNKSDSLEFVRPADANLTKAIFGLVPPSGAKILLRFRLTAVPGGTRIEAVGHLLGRSGLLPYRASAAVLAENLEDLRHDLLAAPGSNGTEVDRVAPK